MEATDTNTAEYQNVHFRLPARVYEALRLAAFKRHESQNQLTVQALEKYLAGELATVTAK